MPSCPDCGSTFTRRIPRTFLMRLLPTSRRVFCRDCGERSLVFPRLAHRAAQRAIVRKLKPLALVHSK